MASAIKVSRFGEIPKPTVTVRMKENGSTCYDDSVSLAWLSVIFTNSRPCQPPPVISKRIRSPDSG